MLNVPISIFFENVPEFSNEEPREKIKLFNHLKINKNKD